MKKTAATLAALIVVVGCEGQTVKRVQDRPPSTVAFEGTDELLYVDIADEPEERRRGLMGVESMPARDRAKH